LTGRAGLDDPFQHEACIHEGIEVCAERAMVLALPAAHIVCSAGGPEPLVDVV
jgi:hypothetical protein